jgi:hypothetical protein
MKKRKSNVTLTESDLKRIIRNEVLRYLKEEEAVDKEFEKEFEDAMNAASGQMTQTLGKVSSEIEKVENDKEKAADILKKEPELAKLATEAIRRRKKALREGKQKQALNELGPLFFVGFALAIPALMELIGNVSSFIAKKIGLTGETGEKIAHIGHDLHEKMIGLIRTGLDKTVFKIPQLAKLDDSKKDKIAKGIHILIVASLAVNSGVEAVNALKAGQAGLSGVEAALAAVKGGEVKTFLIDLVKTVST